MESTANTHYWFVTSLSPLPRSKSIIILELETPTTKYWLSSWLVAYSNSPCNIQDLNLMESSSSAPAR